jgi:hypothetical protein
LHGAIAMRRKVIMGRKRRGEIETMGGKDEKK